MKDYEIDKRSDKYHHNENNIPKKNKLNPIFIVILLHFRRLTFVDSYRDETESNVLSLIGSSVFLISISALFWIRDQIIFYTI